MTENRGFFRWDKESREKMKEDVDEVEDHRIAGGEQIGTIGKQEKATPEQPAARHSIAHD